VVITGTSITAPTSIGAGSGFPGQTVTSEAFTLSWQTTEADQRLTVAMDGDLIDASGNVIAAADATLIRTTDGVDSVVGPLDSPQDLVLITGTSGSQLFKVRVSIPSAAADSYMARLVYRLVAAP
jgi:hypothetical protein